MNWLEAYSLFALATAVTAHYELISPVMYQLGIIKPDHNLIENKFLAHATFFLGSLLFAPPMFLASIIPSWSDRFKKSILNSLLRD